MPIKAKTLIFRYLLRLLIEVKLMELSIYWPFSVNMQIWASVKPPKTCWEFSEYSKHGYMLSFICLFFFSAAADTSAFFSIAWWNAFRQTRCNWNIKSDPEVVDKTVLQSHTQKKAVDSAKRMMQEGKQEWEKVKGSSCCQPLSKSIPPARMERAGQRGNEGKRERGDGNTKGR